MLNSYLTVALFGAALVHARPAPPAYSGTSASLSTSTPSATGVSSAPSASASTPSGPQVPFEFPLRNGFPNITIPSTQLEKIEKEAHGSLPDTPLANDLAAGDITTFEVIATNELFEVAFFSSLIKNITENVAGFEISDEAEKGFVLEALHAVRAQEELHALGANAILVSAGSTAIEPCEYVFPSDTFDTAINFARTFTDVVLGTLQDAMAGLVANGDGEYIPLIGSIIGQEGEQNGYYRAILGLNPSELPFLTRSTGPWAYSALNQIVLVPGSCPSAKQIDVPIFGALNIDTPNIEGKNQKLQFSFTNNGTDTSSISLVYTNQQNAPIVQKVENVKTKGDIVTFEAHLPYEKHVMNGLTIAVVTNSAGPFTSADDVAAATLFGPGLIEIN